MKWETGQQTSVPEDMRAFLERDTDGMWWVYQTGPDGALLENFATHAGPFGSLSLAQDWTEKNVPGRVVAENLARMFHEAYESTNLGPLLGFPVTMPWDKVPAMTKARKISAAADVLVELRKQGRVV